MKRFILPGVVALLVIGIFYWVSSNNKENPSTTKLSDSYTLDYKLDADGVPLEVSDRTDTNQTPTTNDNNKIMQATLKTNHGDIVIEFNPKTPKTVENFVKLAQSGFYDGTKFHRIIAGFMNQGGDPLTKDDSKMDYWGTGGPGYKFADEINSDNRNDVGTISMANAGPNTNGSQFFINVGANNFLDSKHTVFGKVVKGLDVVKAMNSVQTTGAPFDRPIEPVTLIKVEVK